MLTLFWYRLCIRGDDVSSKRRSLCSCVILIYSLILTLLLAAGSSKLDFACVTGGISILFAFPLPAFHFPFSHLCGFAVCFVCITFKP